MSEEIIKILDALAERFGLAVDWTSENILPYVQQLGDRFIRYKTTISIVWIVIGVLFFLGCFGFYKLCKYAGKKNKEALQNRDYDAMYDVLEVAAGIISVGCFIMGTILVIHETFQIITYVNFPEKVIVEELVSISRRLNGTGF